MSTLAPRFIQLENRIHRLLVNHSISALRIVLGATFLGFGLLKYFPDVSRHRPWPPTPSTRSPSG